MKKPVLALLFLLSLNSLMAQTIPQYVSASNLLAWYPFNGDADNEYGTGKNGVVLGPLAATDRFGTANSAYHFDGIDDHIKIDTAFFNVGWDNYSISCWLNSDTFDNPFSAGNSQTLINTIPHNGFGFSLNWNSSDRYMFFVNSNPALIYSWNILNHDSSVATLAGTEHIWKHFVFIKKDDTTYSVYLNGVLDRSFHKSLTALNYFCGIMLGNIDTVYPSESFIGFLDDYGLWDRALANCEVKRLYHASPYTYITAQPVNTSAAVASAVSFSVTDTGTGNTYQWQENSGSGFSDLPATSPYSGVITPTLTITGVTAAMNANKYRCVVSGAQVCVDTSAFAVLNVIPLSIGKVSGADIRITPNPTTGELFVEGAGDVDARIYNGLGMSVAEFKHVDKFSIVALPPGLYVVKLYDKQGGLIYSNKIIKE